jgi:murein DD-endopeptidase MepM/ murein hydrolase activator NlpD
MARNKTASNHFMKISSLFGLIVICTALFVLFNPSSKESLKNNRLEEKLPNFSLRLDERRELLLHSLPVTTNSQIFHSVSKGENWGSIFGEYGFSRIEAELVERELESATKSEKDLKSLLSLGQELVFEINSLGELSKIETELRKDAKFVVRRIDSQNFKGEVEFLPKRNSERVILGAVENSFAETAQKSGAPYEAIDDFVDLFSDHVNFHRDLQPGDRFAIIYQEDILNNREVLDQGTILAAVLEVNNKTYYAVRYVGADGVSRYFNQEGNGLGIAFLRYPLKFSKITSYFSKSRFHPVLKVNRPHNGVDFAAAIGTPVRVISDGVVEVAGARGGSGIMVKVRHNDRYSSAYLHLSKIADGVTTGARVSRGQVIGAVGMTGYATGPHLHFSFYDRGVYVDPLSIELPTDALLTRGQKIDQNYLRRVLFTLDHYQTVDT